MDNKRGICFLIAVAASIFAFFCIPFLPVLSADPHAAIQPVSDLLSGDSRFRSLPEPEDSHFIIPESTRSKYNVGSCSTLEGRPYVITIFLDDDVSCWQESQVSSHWNQLVDPALTYLEENAAGYGVDLEFQSGIYASYNRPGHPIRYNGTVKTFMDGSYSQDIPDQVAASLGFGSKEEMHSSLQEYSGQSKIAYLIMLNKGGRSYSCAYYQHPQIPDESGYLVEYCVIYTGFTDDSGDTGSDCVAHELLHLFGAEDFYILKNRQELAKTVYPKDIMLCDMPDLAYFEIGDFTAYTVGWTNEIPSVCFLSDWWS